MTDAAILLNLSLLVMVISSLLAVSIWLAAIRAQQPGTLTEEVHPKIAIQQCATGKGCTTVSAPLTLDANWRWVHTTNGYTPCFNGNTWNAAYCTDPDTCAQVCALDGANYAGTYGISTSGNAVTMKLTSSPFGVGSRVFLMLSDTAYRTIPLKNQAISFDVDVSALPCGVEGAVTLSEMPADGGQFPQNKAGAKYGTGYCNAQCPRDLKFINGQVCPVYNA